MRSPIHSQAVVQAWFDTLAPGHAALARDLQRLLLEAVPALAQVVKWGNLIFLYRGTHALAIVSHKAHLNLQVFNGAQLAARFEQLAGTGRGLRHLTCRVGQPLDAALVRALATACVETLPGRAATGAPTPHGKDS